MASPVNDILLQYYDVAIRKSDVRLLDNYQWFNDTCIEFYFEYLEHTLCKDGMLILLLRPDIVHLISHAADTRYFGSALPPKMKEREVIFIPVNDNESNSVGGSHWSLLVYHRPSEIFYYYDSLIDYNLSAARKTAKKFEELLELQGATFKLMKTPKQDNGADCGVYVVSITELLSSRFIKHCDQPGAAFTEEFWDITNALPIPSNTRRKMRTLVQELIHLAGGYGGRVE